MAMHRLLGGKCCLIISHGRPEEVLIRHSGSSMSVQFAPVNRALERSEGWQLAESFEPFRSAGFDAPFSSPCENAEFVPLAFAGLQAEPGFR